MKPKEYTSIGGTAESFRTTHWTAIEESRACGSHDDLSCSDCMLSGLSPQEDLATFVRQAGRIGCFVDGEKVDAGWTDAVIFSGPPHLPEQAE